MGGKTKLLRIKQGRVHIHDSGLYAALRIFVSESLSVIRGHRPSATRPLAGILGGSLYREVELMGGDERWRVCSSVTLYSSG